MCYSMMKLKWTDCSKKTEPEPVDRVAPDPKKRIPDSIVTVVASAAAGERLHLMQKKRLLLLLSSWYLSDEEMLAPFDCSNWRKRMEGKGNWEEWAFERKQLMYFCFCDAADEKKRMRSDCYSWIRTSLHDLMHQFGVCCYLNQH